MTSSPSLSDRSRWPWSQDDDDSTTARMRIHISRARGLASRDRNGYSDPYIKLSVGGHKFMTKVVRKSLNPVWDAAFDFDVEAQSLPDCALLMFWDKDRLKSDYLGTVSIPFDSSSLWVDSAAKHFDDPDNEPRWLPLVALPGKFSKVTGEVEVKFGFIDTTLSPVHENSRTECSRIWDRLTSGRNKLGLGQRQFQAPDHSTVTVSDIPMAVGDDEVSLGLGILRLDTPSPPPSIPPSIPPITLPSSTGSQPLRGVVFMEVVSASGLPRTRNMTRTGFDMDPFVVISFGKYIFRTRVIRHNLNPVWRAKLMFRVHYGEESFHIKYSVHDWDKLTGNDYVGMATMDVDELIRAQQQQSPDPASSPVLSVCEDKEGTEKESGDREMKEYNLKISISSSIKQPAENASIKVRAKFVPYTTLRRRFWLGLARSFGAGHQDGLYSKVLIQAMLDGLGSTLSTKTVNSFFTRYSKDPEQDELTFDEFFERLERQVKLDDSTPHKRRRIRRLGKFWSRKSAKSKKNAKGLMIEPFEDREVSADSSQELDDKDSADDPTEVDSKDATEDSMNDDEDEEDTDLFQHVTQTKSPTLSEIHAADSEDPTDADFDPQQSEDEYVIRISACPICRDSSLGSKLETDVITHIAVCSGNDGFNMDKLILGNFVTEANAQRKWITKVVKTVSYGRYLIGKSNANILVQDRITGAMMEEKIPSFIRLGIRLLYKGPAQKIRVRKVLANMSRKQGLKFDDPRSKRNIEPFIRFHHLEAHMNEVLEPMSNFRTFNEFFYRKLKPDARQLHSLGDDRVAVSVADCRMTCYPTIEEATKFWIKGRQFTVARLLDDEVLAKKFDGGSLAIFRLAPQDYHRFHIPVRGVMSEPKSIDGAYFTVNPMSIRSHLDVYGENKRVISTIETKEFGTVAYCSIGAMMVGSIILTTTAGQQVERMDEHGYFAFGGSTIVLLFERNSIQFDEDLVRSSRDQLEMLVRVGMRIGVSTRA